MHKRSAFSRPAVNRDRDAVFLEAGITRLERGLVKILHGKFLSAATHAAANDRAAMRSSRY
jgi:hypothetical protein